MKKYFIISLITLCFINNSNSVADFAEFKQAISRSKMDYAKANDYIDKLANKQDIGYYKGTALEGKTPLQYVMSVGASDNEQSNKQKIIKKLVDTSNKVDKGASITVANADNQNALMLGIIADDVKAVKYLFNQLTTQQKNDLFAQKQWITYSPPKFKYVLDLLKKDSDADLKTFIFEQSKKFGDSDSKEYANKFQLSQIK